MALVHIQVLVQTGVNHEVTRMKLEYEALESGNNASTIDADDLYIGSGSVSAMQSCSDATGTTLLSSETTRITLKLQSLERLQI